MVTGKVRAARRGATLVEFACVVGVFLVMSFAVFEYGRFFMMQQLVQNAAREGARIAVTNTNNPNTDVTGTVQAALANQSLTVQTINVDGWTYDTKNKVMTKVAWYNTPVPNPAVWTDPNIANSQYDGCIVVQVTATYQPMLPSFGFLPGSMTLQSTAVMRSEAN
jgi:Flp pilus assembly protein TadG